MMTAPAPAPVPAALPDQLEQTATVVARHGGHAWVRAERQTVCGHCASRAGCGTALLERLFGRRPSELLVRDPLDTRVGDRVTIGIPEPGLLGLAAALYLIPVLGLVAGILLGAHWVPADWPVSWRDAAALTGGLLGMGLALLWLRADRARYRRDPARQPTIVRLEDF